MRGSGRSRSTTTFHIDTSQGRPGVEARTETDLNPVRLKFARMLAEAGFSALIWNPHPGQKAPADMLGTYRETISAILRSFKDEGLVELGYRKIELRDVRALRATAGILQ